MQYSTYQVLNKWQFYYKHNNMNASKFLFPTLYILNY